MTVQRKRAALVDAVTGSGPTPTCRSTSPRQPPTWRPHNDSSPSSRPAQTASSPNRRTSPNNRTNAIKHSRPPIAWWPAGASSPGRCDAIGSLLLGLLPGGTAGRRDRRVPHGRKDAGYNRCRAAAGHQLRRPPMELGRPRCRPAQSHERVPGWNVGKDLVVRASGSSGWSRSATPLWKARGSANTAQPTGGAPTG